MTDQLRNCRNGKRLLKQRIAILKAEVASMINVCKTYDVELAETHRARPLLEAVIAIWKHTEKHTTYIEGIGYRWRTGELPCDDPELHKRLAAAEGKAWHDFRAGRLP
jgi:hypothetical protein